MARPQTSQPSHFKTKYNVGRHRESMSKFRLWPGHKSRNQVTLGTKYISFDCAQKPRNHVILKTKYRYIFRLCPGHKHRNHVILKQNKYFYATVKKIMHFTKQGWFHNSSVRLSRRGIGKVKSPDFFGHQNGPRCSSCHLIGPKKSLAPLKVSIVCRYPVPTI